MNTPNITNRLYLETMLTELNRELHILDSEHAILVKAHSAKRGLVMGIIDSVRTQLDSDDKRKVK
jgi:hypothetical protein